MIAGPFAGLVCVPWFGQIGVVVYVTDPDDARKALTLAAFLYANEEAERRERERAA